MSKLPRRAFVQASAVTMVAAPSIAQGIRVFTFGHDEPHDTGYGFLLTSSRRSCRN